MEEESKTFEKEVVDSSVTLTFDSTDVSSSDHAIWPHVSELDLYLEIHRLSEKIELLEQSTPSFCATVALTLGGAVFSVLFGMWAQRRIDGKKERERDANILNKWEVFIGKTFNLYLLNKESRVWNEHPSFVNVRIEYQKGRLRIVGDSEIKNNGSIEGFVSLREPTFTFGLGSYFHDKLKNGKPLLGDFTVYLREGIVFSDHEPYSTKDQKRVLDRYKWVESKPRHKSDSREDSNVNDVFKES